MSIFEQPQRLAKLLCSIKVNTSDRPLNPVQVAFEINDALKDLDGDYQKLENRLSIKKDMIKAFFRLLDLPEQIQEIIMWGQSNSETGEISFTSAQELSKLEKPEDVLTLVSAIHSLPRPVTKEEIKSIVSLKKSNKEMDLSKCIEQVLAVGRVEKIESFLYISGVNLTILENIIKKSEENQLTQSEIIKEILGKIISKSEITNLKIGSDHIRLYLTKNGMNQLKEFRDKNKIDKNNLLNYILSGEI